MTSLKVKRFRWLLHFFRIFVCDKLIIPKKRIDLQHNYLLTNKQRFLIIPWRHLNIINTPLNFFQGARGQVNFKIYVV